MDIIGMGDHYNNVLKSNLCPSEGLQHCQQGADAVVIHKERSPVIESLQQQSNTAMLLPPQPVSDTSMEMSAAFAAIASSSSSSSSSLSVSSASSSSPCALSPTLSSFSLALSLSSPKALTRSNTRRHSNTFIPYYASCFSPLDLPTDIFVYLLEFFSPADLWRLSQVSRAMQLKVIGFMSRIQRVKYGAVRILHQEHADCTGQASGFASEQTQRGHTFYKHMTFGALSSSSLRMSLLMRAKGASLVQSRSSYWLAQARFLVATITEGTAYEPRLELPLANKGACRGVRRETGPGVRSAVDTAPHAASAPRLSFPSLSSSSVNMSSSASLSSVHLSTGNIIDSTESYSPLLVASSDMTVSEETTELILPSGSHLPQWTASEALAAPQTGVAPPSTAAPSVPPVSSGYQNASSVVQIHIPEPLPLDRFNAMVGVIFDPNVVQLNHRRAIINCARYVSASVDESFAKAVSTQEPQSADFHAAFQAQYTIRTGPYLTVCLPILYSNEGLELSPTERALAGSIKDSTITPPQRLHNYFQVMLWHRCMTGLISLYNRVQDRHLDAPPGIRQPSKAKTTAVKSMIPTASTDIIVLRYQSATPINHTFSTTTTSFTVPDDYPFCCRAHSLDCATQHSFNFVPYTIRVQFQRMFQMVKLISQQSIWSNAFNGLGLGRRERSTESVSTVSAASTRRRTIRYTGPTSKLQFCNSHHSSSSSSNRKSSASQPSALSLLSAPSSLQRRSRSEVEEDELVQRRYRVEESIRQDNLVKQELLALCHMACGLFLTDDRSIDPPATIMSLLKGASPWSKGIWREGEWRYDAIGPQQPDKERTNSAYSHTSKQNRHQQQSRAHGSQSSASSPAEGYENIGSMAEEDMGPWQRICVATIQFLAHEDLAWGGNRTNAELSRLRATSNATAWIYHE
ncbi:hypothetical protein EDD11_005353 [Mortierella claussenii]|nr:hypothetical protein EDD11_005353 [Mortierella claussenii]